MIKVLHLLGGNLTFGGVEVGISKLLANTLSSLDYRVFCCGSVDEKFSNSFFIPLVDNILLATHGSNKKISLRNLAYMVRFLNEFKPDVIVLSLWKSVFLFCFLFLFYKPKKIILFIHSTRFKHFFDKIFSYFGAFFADVIFYDSTASKECLPFELFNREKRVISFFHSRPEFFKAQINNEDLFRFVSISRISKEKGFQFAILFFEHLIASGIDFEWHIYGSISDYSELDYINRFIQKNNLDSKVKLLGVIKPSEVFNVLINYDFYLQFSIYEGMAMSVSEAMSVGLVCVVNPVGEIKNYSVDMDNSVHLEFLSKEGIEGLVRKFLRLNKAGKFNEISKRSIINFSEKELLFESFSKEINRLV